MIHQYKNPSVKFMENKQNFNKLLGILTFQEQNFVEDEWKEKVHPTGYQRAERNGRAPRCGQKSVFLEYGAISLSRWRRL